MSKARDLRFKKFPSFSGHVRVPIASRHGALAGIALYAACRPWTLRAQRLAWLGVRIFGPWILPGPAVEWAPADDETWDALSTRWREELGAFDEVAGFERQQRTRVGHAVLLIRRGSPLAFVRMRDGRGPGPATDGGLHAHATEEAALRAVAHFGPRSFGVPRPLASGRVKDVDYLVIEPFAAGLHRPPANPPIETICEEVGAALSSLPRPQDTPAHWRPMHGDLALWNLRAAGKRIFLIDWEDVGWGPPGADELYYRATAATLSNAALDWTGDDETLEYLLRHTAGEKWRGDSRRDDEMVAGMQRVLRAVRARRSSVALGGDRVTGAAIDAR